MEVIKGPDFPTAGAIHGTAGIKSAYHTGKELFKFVLRLKLKFMVSKKEKE
jgi:DNA gyrase subunit A